MITGKTLIEMGYSPGPWFADAIAAAREAEASGGDIRAAIDRHAPSPAAPTIPLRAVGELAHRMNIRAEDQDEVDNVAAVERHMVDLMRVPTVVAGAVMPDACPSGWAPGTIPVGGVIAAKEAIHPGMHSSDICCSMALSVFGEVDPTTVLDAGMKLSHFGGGGRSYSEDMRPSGDLLAQFEGNRFLSMMTDVAVKHFGTQGDGNHFFYVGRVASTGQVALVTHHGSGRPHTVAAT
jgi:tRNA-splicing ligase RtcB